MVALTNAIYPPDHLPISLWNSSFSCHMGCTSVGAYGWEHWQPSKAKDLVSRCNSGHKERISQSCDWVPQCHHHSLKRWQHPSSSQVPASGHTEWMPTSWIFKAIIGICIWVQMIYFLFLKHSLSFFLLSYFHCVPLHPSTSSMHMLNFIIVEYTWNTLGHLNQ